MLQMKSEGCLWQNPTWSEWVRLLFYSSTVWWDPPTTYIIVFYSKFTNLNVNLIQKHS